MHCLTALAVNWSAGSNVTFSEYDLLAKFDRVMWYVNV